jgi:hypothetical protein
LAACQESNEKGKYKNLAGCGKRALKISRRLGHFNLRKKYNPTPENWKWLP